MPINFRRGVGLIPDGRWPEQRPKVRSIFLEKRSFLIFAEPSSAAVTRKTRLFKKHIYTSTLIQIFQPEMSWWRRLVKEGGTILTAQDFTKFRKLWRNSSSKELRRVFVLKMKKRNIKKRLKCTIQGISWRIRILALIQNCRSKYGRSLCRLIHYVISDSNTSSKNHSWSVRMSRRGWKNSGRI